MLNYTLFWRCTVRCAVRCSVRCTVRCAVRCAVRCTVRCTVRMGRFCLTLDITGPTISVGGVCLPGAGLLDVVGPRQMSTESGTRCEVLMAGTNDLAVGKQNKIYSHLETYITARPINTDIVLVTLPHRHDLEPDHSIHDETALVNAYIEELAIRHNIKVLNFNRIGRRHFTRHGMHLSMRGKRILAGMIVESLALLIPVPPEPEKPLLVTAVPPAVVPPPAATPWEPAAVSQRSPRLQLVSYAEAARASTTPDRDSRKEGSPMSKNCSGQTCVKPT
ncbi:hypothetical protein J6590_023188 [Homalodisca vitripennis]|nr:hypothetical protein J6590_023188 [Homalodisca vitripennis]